MKLFLSLVLACMLAVSTLSAQALFVHPTYTVGSNDASLLAPVSYTSTQQAALPSRTSFVPSQVTVAAPKTFITELGLTFPLKPSSIKDYINTNGITTLPLTSGYSSGFQVGRHSIVSNQATIGVVLGANGFIGSTPTATNQIYQIGIYATGRLYFGESWRGGAFAELGAGPEASAASFNGSNFEYQGNIGARVGAGYNYKFTNDVTLGVSLLATPAVSSAGFLDGAKVVVNMLW